MNLIYLTAGAGRRECDACLRDAHLARALIARGHQVLFVPTYTPLISESQALAADELFYGGINVFLQQRYALFRRTPRFIDRMFDQPRLLRAAGRLRSMTRSNELAEMTISMLEGRDGRQVKELERLIDWLALQPPPDVFILPNTLFAGLAGPLRERFGVPVVSLLSGEDTFVESFPEPFRGRALAILRRRAGELDGLVALSGFYAGHMSGWLGVPRERIDTVVLGFDVSPYRACPRTEPEVFTIGYRSPICEAQGLHVLAEAFALLKRQPETARCRLRAAGYLEPSERPYLEKIVADLRREGFDQDFEYVGELDAAERVQFVTGLSVFCAPPVYPEPFALFVPEALAAGVPVVASRAGCLPEWVEATGGGIVCEADDPAALAEALARLAGDPAWARSLGEQGRDAVWTRHSGDAMAGSMLAALARRMPQPGNQD